MLPYETSLPLRIELRPSRWLRLMLAMLAACATLALWRSHLPAASLLLVPALLAVAWPRAARWSALVLRADGTAVAADRDGMEHPVEVKGLELRGPLALLHLDEGGRTRRLPLLPDVLPSAPARLLRLWAERNIERDPDARSVARV